MGDRGRLGQFVGLSTVALLLGALPATAGLVVELEPNDTFATAQILAPGSFTLDLDPNIGTGFGGGFVNTSTVIPHVTITESGDTSASLDFFSFTTTVAGVIILDIDSAPQATNFDTEIHLFDAAGTPLASSDDNGDDPGDTPGAIIGGAFNSRIETGVLPAGNYVAAVSTFISVASPGGNVSNTIDAGGTYTLNISAQASAQAAVPAPATLLALGAGLIGLGAGAWWRRRR